MGFSRQEYWSGLPFPLPGDLPNPGIEPTSLASPALAGRFFTTEPPGELRKVHGLLFFDFYQELLSEAKLQEQLVGNIHHCNSLPLHPPAPGAQAIPSHPLHVTPGPPLCVLNLPPTPQSPARPSNLVLEGSQAEVQQVQDTTQLREGQVRSPALQQGRLSVLQDPQHTHQQGPAGLSREGIA